MAVLQPSPPAPAFRLDGVSVVRGGRAVVRGVDWTVWPGQRWVVLGPNGSGKTTLLTVAAAQRLPSRGAAEVLGHRLGRVDLRDLRREIGYASMALADLVRPTTTALDLVVTVRHGATVRWRQPVDAADEARARALLDELGCGGLADRAFSSLSEGERKRVQLARALHAGATLLLLDEPAAGLDLGARERLVTRLGTVTATTVLVSHHVEEVPSRFTHALLLRDGEVVASGPIAAALTAETLSACFGLPLRLERRDGRLFARAAAGGRAQRV